MKCSINKFQPNIILGIFVALALTALPLYAADDVPSAPDWTLPDDAGQQISFYAHSAERPAVLLFWATWCPYCQKLMPHLEKLRAEFAARGVPFYALNIWEDGDPVAYLDENELGFHLILKADEVAKAYGVKGTPGLFAVDQTHHVRYSRISGTTPTQVENDLRSILEDIAN